MRRNVVKRTELDGVDGVNGVRGVDGRDGVENGVSPYRTPTLPSCLCMII